MSDDLDLIAPSAQSESEASPQTREVSQEFLARLLSGDETAMAELRKLAEASERFDEPVEVAVPRQRRWLSLLTAMF